MLPLLHRQLIYADECVALLGKYANGETDKEYINAYCQRHGIARELVAPLFEAPMAITRHVAHGLALPQAQLERLFGREADAPCIADYFTLSYNDAGAQEILGRVRHHTPRQRLAYLYAVVYGVLENRILTAEEAPEELTMENLLRAIVSSSRDNPAQIMRLTDFCLNLDELSLQLADILERAAVLLREKEHLAYPQLQAAWTRLEEMVQSEGMDMIRALMPMAGQFTQPYQVYVSIIASHSLRYSVTLDNNSEQLFVGMNVLPLKDLEKQFENIGAAADALKTLGDKTKLDILRALRGQPMYGQELAALLNLSTATISYHMSLLLKHDFVLVERDNSRIYYQLNPQGLRSQFKRAAMMLGIDLQE